MGGPSPRVRGIRHPLEPPAGWCGSIPAGAGNPAAAPVSSRSGRVHPRGCGESAGEPERLPGGGGPSPRVRGIRKPPCASTRRAGSIPAGAGNPSAAPSPWIIARVHPRGCGESGDGEAGGAHGPGPSPRVRGIRSPAERRWTGARVHPRGCGESPGRRFDRPDEAGPSPRVRGIQIQSKVEDDRGGSIPAGAGNPGWRWS